MASMLVPNVAQGYGIDLSHMRVGIDLLRDQPLYYWSSPRYGLVGIYPVGMSLLAAPLQGLLWALASWEGVDVSVGSPHFANTRFLLEKMTASCLAGLTTLYVYKSLTCLLSRKVALFVVALYMMGSSSVSLLTQGLWQQTGINLLTSMLLYFLLSQPGRPSITREVLFLVTVGFLCVIRPTAVVWSAAFVFLYWRLYGKPSLVGALSMTVAIAPAIVWNLVIFGQLLGGYATVESKVLDLNFVEWFSRLPLILFSCSKGLLVFNPFLCCTAFLWFCRKRLEQRYQVIVETLLCVELCNLALCGTNPTWHGGRGFGPRYMVESLGIMFVLSAISLSYIRERFPRTTTAAVVAMTIGSVTLNIFGAIGARLDSPALVDLHQRMLMP